MEIRSILKEHGGSYRSRQVIVPEDEQAQWVLHRLAKAGLEVSEAELELSAVAFADLGRRGGRIPYLSVTATGVVRDAPALEHAVVHGIGKGKNFGLGLLRINPSSSSSSALASSKESPA